MQLNDAQIKHMVEKFLRWKLPENFSPDGGISFQKTFNDHTPHPMKHEPVGTNLFDYNQADTMVRDMIEGMPAGASTSDAVSNRLDLLESRMVLVEDTVSSMSAQSVEK